MFIPKNPCDKPDHHKKFISAADAGKAYAPIVFRFSCISFVVWVLLVLAVIGFCAPDRFSAVASIVGISGFSFLTVAYLALRLALNNHRRHLAKFGVSE